MMYSGGCLCGKLRYATDAGVAFGGNCHCRDCQRATGAGSKARGHQITDHWPQSD